MIGLGASDDDMRVELSARNSDQEMDMETTLDQAIVAAKAGRRGEARRLLEAVLAVDERNEQAWLWLSGVVDDDEERIICLENVLTINPHNEAARRGLAALGATPVADQPDLSHISAELADGSPLTLPVASPAEAPDLYAPADHSTTPDRRAFIVITIVLVLMLICIVVSILAFVVLLPLG